MNTRGRKIEFAEMANPHLRITGRIMSKSTTTKKKKRALSLDGTTLSHSDVNRKSIHLSDASKIQSLTPKSSSDHGNGKERSGPNLSSAERAMESDASSLAENSPNQSKCCDFTMGRARQNGRKTRPFEVMTKSTVLNSPETEGEGTSSMTSSPSFTAQTEQSKQQESISDETHRRALTFDTSAIEATPPVDAVSPVEPDTSRRSLRTNRSRDYKFLAGLCSENHLKRKLPESETGSRRISDQGKKGCGRNAKKAHLEGEEKATPEGGKVFGLKFTKDDCVRTFERMDAAATSNSEAENANCAVRVKTEIDDKAFRLIADPSDGEQSSVECLVKLENASDDIAQINLGKEKEGEEEALPVTETDTSQKVPESEMGDLPPCPPPPPSVNSQWSVETIDQRSSTESKEIQLEINNIKASDVEQPQTNSQIQSKCPYKDPLLLCLIEKLNSGAKTPSGLNSPTAEVGRSLKEKVDGETSNSHETSFEEETVGMKLEAMDGKPSWKVEEEEEVNRDDSDDRSIRSLSLDLSMNGLLQPKLEPQETMSRRRINARKSFEMTLARATSASSSDGVLTNSPSSAVASVDGSWNSCIKTEKEGKGREGQATSADFLWNSSDVKLEKERKEKERERDKLKERGRSENRTKHLTSVDEKCSYDMMTSSHDTSIESLLEQTSSSVFVSHDLDEYLALSPVRRKSVQREEVDEPEMDEIDGFTFMAFPSLPSLEKHMRKLNVSVLSLSLSSSRHRFGDGLGLQSGLATAEARAACRRKREALLKSGKVKRLSLETLSELGVEIDLDPSDAPSAEPSADESASFAAKVTRRGIAKMGNEKRQPRKGKIYGRKVTGRFASKANIKYHVKKTSPDSIAQSNLKGKGQASASLGAPLKKGVLSQKGSFDMNWKPVVMTMKMAIAAVRALSIHSVLAHVPCNQTDCTCSGKREVQPEYEPPNVSSVESVLVQQQQQQVGPMDGGGGPSSWSCEKEHCRLGCVCDSLKTPTKRTTNAKAHCGRPDCMFGCDCERLTRSKVLLSRLGNSGETDRSDREEVREEVSAEHIDDVCEPGTKKRKRRGWGIPIDEDLGFFEEQGTEGGQSLLRKSNRIKERPQLQDFKKLRKMIYDDIYEWENEEQLRPKRRKVQKLIRRVKEPKRLKYLRTSLTGGQGGSVTKVSASVVLKSSTSATLKTSTPAALGRAPTETAATPVSVKTEPPTFEISDDDVKIVSPEARKNGRLEVVTSGSGVNGGRNETQKKMAMSENVVHVAPPAASESTIMSEEDLEEELDDTVTSCARLIIYKRKQGFGSLVSTQNFTQPKSTQVIHHSRSLLTGKEQLSNASDTKQRLSTATTKPFSGNPAKDNVVLGNAKVPPSGVGIFTRSVILVKKETGKGKPEERKPVVVLNMSYNVPLEHCKESIASKVYGVWTDGLAVVGQSFEYDNLLVEFLPKSDKEIQIPPHIRDTINRNDVHEITIRITKKRENRRNPLVVQKSPVPAKVPSAAEPSEISLSGLKNFVSGGAFDSNLSLSNANRLGTSCVLGPFGMAKSTVCAKMVFPPLVPTTDDGLPAAIAATATLQSDVAESCTPVSPETHSAGSLASTSMDHESHTVHWKSTDVGEEGRGESVTVAGTVSGIDESLGSLLSEVIQPVTVDRMIPELDLAGGSAELKKLLLAGIDRSPAAPSVAITVPTSSQANIPSESVVIPATKSLNPEEVLELNVMASSSGGFSYVLAPSSSSVPSIITGIDASSSSTSSSVAPTSNVDAVTSGGDQLVIANTFKINPKTFDSLPSSSTNATPPIPSSSASTQPGFRLIGVNTSKNNSLLNSFHIASSSSVASRPVLVPTSANPTGLIVSVSSGSLPRSGLMSASRIHLAPALSLPVSSGAMHKPTSFLVVPKTMVSSLVKTGSTSAGSLLPAQQMVPGGCLVVANSKVLKIGVPVCSMGSTRGESLLQTVAMAAKTNSSFIQVKPVNTSASGQQRMMIVSTVEATSRPRPSTSLVLKQPGGGGGTDVRQLATRFAGQSPSNAKDVIIEIKDDSDEEKGVHDEEIDILREAEAEGSNEAAILSEKLGIRLESFSSSSKMDASSTGGGQQPMPPPPTQHPPSKQKRKQMHEEKAEFNTNVEITEGWVRIPTEENKADPVTSPAVPSPAVPSVVPSSLPLVPSSLPLVPSGQSAEIEMTVVGEKEKAPSLLIRPSVSATTVLPQPNLYVELYKAITPYLKQTDKTKKKKKKISPLYITRKATQVIKRITEWQSVLINDLLKERMIYDKLKKRQEKLTATVVGQKDLTSGGEPSGQTSSSLQHPSVPSAKPLPSERRRVPGPLRRKFRGVSRKEEDESQANNKPPEEEAVSLAAGEDTTMAASDIVATDHAIVAMNDVAVGDAVAMGDIVAMENTVAKDNTGISSNTAFIGGDVSVAGSDVDAIGRHDDSADAEENAHLVSNRSIAADVKRRDDESSDSSEAIQKASDDSYCRNTTFDISVGLSCDSVALITTKCTLNEKESSLHETLASSDSTEHLQGTDFCDKS